jgi:hypothetical protein
MVADIFVYQVKIKFISQFVEFFTLFFAILGNALPFSLSKPTVFPNGIHYALLTTKIIFVAGIDINGRQIPRFSE